MQKKIVKTPKIVKPKKKSKKRSGRPTKYRRKYCEAIVKFFSGDKFEQFIKSEKVTTKKNGTTETLTNYGYRCNDLPTFAKFARSIGVDKDTIVEWAKSENKKKYKGFSVAYNSAKELQKEFLSDNALRGFSPPASFIFVAKNITDWKDKQEVDTKHSGELVVRRASYKDLDKDIGNVAVS